MTVALLDGDIIAYRAASVLVDDCFDDQGGKSPLAESEAIHAAHLMVQSWRDAAGCDRAMIFLTGQDNFRTRILPTYTLNRKVVTPPATLAAVKASLLAGPSAYLVEGLEADDLMGICLTNGRYPGAVCVTVDKDLRTVPGRHFNPVKKGEVVGVTTPEQGRFWWLTQTLTGDKVDGYSGCPAVGPVKASKILSAVPYAKLWDAVRDTFLACGLTEKDALVQARVARILHASDYDRESKEILLWHPTTPVRIPLDMKVVQ